MSTQSILLGTFLIAGAVVNAILVYFVWSIREEKKGATLGAFILMAGCIWIFNYALELLFLDLPTKIFFSKVKRLGVYAFPTLWFIFSFYYTGREKWLTRRVIIWISIIPFISLILASTNEFHGLFWSEMSLVTEKGLTIIKDKDTSLHFIFNSYGYGLFFLGCVNLIRNLLKKPVLYRTQIRVTILLFCISIFIYFVRYLLPEPLEDIEAEPICFALVSVPYCWVFYRWRITDIAPVAHQVILDGISDAVIVLDEASCILTLNNAAQPLFDDRPTKVIGFPIKQVLPEWPDHLSVPLDGTDPPLDIYLNRGGTKRIYNLRISPLLDIRNNIISEVIVLRDITDIRQAEGEIRTAYNQLQTTQAQLIQSGKLASIGELASGVAHELNQPLMVIRALTQFLERNLQKRQISDDELLAQLEPIERNTKRMMNIINHLRTFSRQSQSDFQPVDVNKIVDNCFLMVGEQLRLRNIEIEKQLTPDLPKIKGDPNQLEQVFLNLITNARDAMGEDGGTLTVVTQCNSEPAASKSETKKDLVELLFKDTGKGIPLEHRDKIFDPFFTTKDVGKGTGLGLSISYGIIKEHQGEIEVAETGPDGTTFRIRLLCG